MFLRIESVFFLLYMHKWAVYCSKRVAGAIVIIGPLHFICETFINHKKDSP